MSNTVPSIILGKNELGRLPLFIQSLTATFQIIIAFYRSDGTKAHRMVNMQHRWQAPGESGIQRNYDAIHIVKQRWTR